MVESGALLKRCTSKGYRGFESLPHRAFNSIFGVGRWAFGVFLIVPRRRVAIPGDDVVLRVPEIALRFVGLSTFLFFLLDRGQAFRFLISPSAGITRHIGGLATDEQRGAGNQANELKVLHMFSHIIIRFRL